MMTTDVQTQVLGEFASMGFTLDEPDDHTMTLKHDGETVGNFIQSGANRKSIQAECTRHLAEKHGWNSSRKEVNDSNKT